MTDHLLLTNATVVTPNRVIDGGTVVVEDGRITAVGERAYPNGPEVIDLAGRLLLPGLVDLHSDGLERELAPRPGAEIDPAYALAVYDRKLAAAGVTTQFHGVYFANSAGFGRSVEHGVATSRAVRAFAAAPYRLIDHRVLHRLDLRTPDALDGLLGVLDGDGPHLVSINEHVPGQGQWWDLAALRRQLAARQGDGDAAAVAEIARRLRHAEETELLAAETLERIGAEGRRRGLILASHDDDSPERVDAMADAGCGIAEFPLNATAAEHARRRGMRVAVGAPNAVRGTSLAGNASALDLLRRGLVDLLVADYHAPSLLAALCRVVDDGLMALPAAAALVTANPAAAVGLDDRGAIDVGRRADLIVVARHGPVPLVEATFVCGSLAYAAGPGARAFAAAGAPAPALVG